MDKREHSLENSQEINSPRKGMFPENSLRILWRILQRMKENYSLSLPESMEKKSFPREWEMKGNGENSPFFGELFPENDREFSGNKREFSGNVLQRIFPKNCLSFTRE